VLDVDERSFSLVIDRAPAHWVTWKDELLAGRVDDDVARQVGRLVGTWHRATSNDPGVVARFDQPLAFTQLRVDPYYRTVASRCPDVAAPVHAAADAMLAHRECLVHGDLSPKNVLVGDGRVWIIDFEVAHLGDPAFDVAFLLSHLWLKSVHGAAPPAVLSSCAAAFAEGYSAAHTLPPTDRVGVHTGCLVMARVDGKSPVEYLTGDERDVARRLGRALLDGRADPWDVDGVTS
jgi:5-methylthioribose kinase